MAHIPLPYVGQVSMIIAALQENFPGAECVEEKEKKGLKSEEEKKADPPGYIISWGEDRERRRVKVFFNETQHCLVIKFLVGKGPFDERTSPVMWPHAGSSEQSMVPDAALICERVRKEVRLQEQFRVASKKAVKKMNGGDSPYHHMGPEPHCPHCRPRPLRS